MTCVDTLPPSLQQLVDSRLDSIERVLLCTNIDRKDRREIVQSVEDQIYELLFRRDEREPSRDSVLAVLAMTDPPEAYLSSNEMPKHAVTSDSCQTGPINPAELTRRVTPLAVVSCVLGILSLISLFLWPVSVISGLAATICGAVALTQISYSGQLKGVWLSVIGVCSPAIAMITVFVLVNF